MRVPDSAPAPRALLQDRSLLLAIGDANRPRLYRLRYQRAQSQITHDLGEN